jgi:hypothetical protein
MGTQENVQTVKDFFAAMGSHAASRGPRSWRSQARVAGWSYPWIIGWNSLPDTAHIKSGSRAAAARRIPSATHPLDRRRNGLDSGRALAGSYREWALSRRESWNGLAARRFSRTDGKNAGRPRRGALRAPGWSFARNAAGAAALLAAGQPRLLAATNPDRC